MNSNEEDFVIDFVSFIINAHNIKPGISYRSPHSEFTEGIGKAVLALSYVFRAKFKHHFAKVFSQLSQSKEDFKRYIHFYCIRMCNEADVLYFSSFLMALAFVSELSIYFFNRNVESYLWDGPFYFGYLFETFLKDMFITKGGWKGLNIFSHYFARGCENLKAIINTENPLSGIVPYSEGCKIVEENITRKMCRIPQNDEFVHEPRDEMNDTNLCASSSQDGSCISYENYSSLYLISSQSGNEFDYFDASKSLTETTVAESDPSERDLANFEARTSNSLTPIGETQYQTASHSDEVRNSEECEITCYISGNSVVNVEKHSRKSIHPLKQNMDSSLDAGNKNAGLIMKKTVTGSCESLSPSRGYRNPEIENWVKFDCEKNTENLAEKYSPTMNLHFVESEVVPNYVPTKISELKPEINESGPLDPKENSIFLHEVTNLPLLSEDILSSHEESRIINSYEKCVTEDSVGKAEKIKHQEEIALTEEANETHFQNSVNGLLETGISDIMTSSESLPKGNATDQLSTSITIESSDNKICRYAPSSEDVTKPTDDTKSSTSKASLDLECELDDPKEEFVKRWNFYSYAYMLFQSEPINHLSDELAVKYLKELTSKNFSLPVGKKCVNRNVIASEVSTASRDDSLSLLEFSDESIEYIPQVTPEVGNGSSFLHKTSCVENKTTPSISLVENVTNASEKPSHDHHFPTKHPEPKFGGLLAETPEHQSFSEHRKCASVSPPIAENLPLTRANWERDNPPNDTHKEYTSEVEDSSNLSPYSADFHSRDVKFSENKSAESAATTGKLATLLAKVRELISQKEFLKQVMLPLILRYSESVRLENEARLDVDERHKSSTISLSANTNSERTESEIENRHNSSAEYSELRKLQRHHSCFFLNLDTDESQIHSMVPSPAHNNSEQDKAEATSQLNSNVENAVQEKRQLQQTSRRRKKKKGKRR